MILLAVFAIAMKCAFPDIPLKKILRPKNILFILAGTGILGAADSIVPLFWKGYTVYRFIIMLAGGFAVLAALGIPFVIHYYKKQKELKESGEKPKIKKVLENTFLRVKEEKE